MYARNDAASTPQNTAVVVPVLANDWVTPDGAPLDPSSVQVLAQASNGTATADPDGTDHLHPRHRLLRGRPVHLPGL